MSHPGKNAAENLAAAGQGRVEHLIESYYGRGGAGPAGFLDNYEGGR